jgi:hypothetical protein
MGVLFYAWAALFAVAAITSFFGTLGGRGMETPIFLVIGFMVCTAVFLFPAGYLNRAATSASRLKQMRRTVDLEDVLAAQHAFWRFFGVVSIILFCVFAVGYTLTRIH